MGTRTSDQPAEHWAGPESLDPTPVWKQYALIALLLIVGLVVVIVVAVAALAPNFVTPPALVFGDRLVLPVSDVPAVGAAPKLIGSPLVDDARSFFLVQPEKGTVLALRARWRVETSSQECRVFAAAPSPSLGFASSDCGGTSSSSARFDAHGAPADTSAARGLDQYLVAVSGDRVIVNLSRTIEPNARTVAPVPTGIPQPQQP